MKKSVNFLVALVATLFSSTAFGQFNVDYKPANGYGKILVNSTISGLKPMSHGTRTVEFSNNSGFNPVIDQKIDSIHTGRTMSFKDTFPVSVSYPTNFYVRSMAYAKDTSGKIDTAGTIKFLPILITPSLKKPTMSNLSHTVGQTTANVYTSFNSGYDSGYAELTISFGDSLYLHPSKTYRIKKTTYPFVGPNQNINHIFNLNIGSMDNLFSYRILHHTSFGDTLSPIRWGRTLADTAPAMVSSPYNLQSWADSISFYDETITGGLKTDHKVYRANSATGKATDSISVIYIAGLNNGVIKRNCFKNLTPETNYWVWSSVKNSMNQFPATSNRVLIQTEKKQVTVFKLTIDSTASVNTNTQAIYISAQIPTGKSAQIVILGRRSPNGQTTVLGNITLYPENPYAKILYNGCIEGQNYDATVYGSDANHTRDYDAWEVMTTFKFKPNYTASVVKVQNEKIVVYPNPAKDVIHASEPIILFNSLGEKVRDGKDFFIDDLPRGLYFYYSTLNQNIISGKVMLE